MLDLKFGSQFKRDRRLLPVKRLHKNPVIALRTEYK